MKIFIFTLLLTLTISYANSQILEPVKWTIDSKKISDKEIEIIYTAKIDAGWHLYSQHIKPNGPTPTNFILEESTKYTQIGKVIEEKGYLEYEKVYKMEIKYFKDKAVFKQKIRKTTSEKIEIIGEIEFLTCNNGSCIPGYFDIEVEI